jgi:anti-sigma factor RsiW
VTSIVRCDEKDRLIAYLYGEDAPQDRAALEAHLAVCRACAAEVAGLRDVRASLSEWDAPELAGEVRVTLGPQRSRSWWRAPVLMWAQAAAAVLVLSAGAAVANLEVRYGNGGFSIHTGWRPTQSSGPAVASVAPASSHQTSNDAAWRTALADTEQRLRAEFAGRLRTATVATPARVTGADDLLRQVHTLIDESEQRQQRELALRLTQVVRDFETQRRADLVRIEQNMGQIEGVTGAEAAHQRELLNYLVRVSQRR